MSNTNLEDVIVQLTETRNELSEEDLRLWDGLENERVSRIAGDDANKSLTLQVQDSVSGTERRLSTEVIHREQGDLDKLGVLNQLSQSLSAYRIKTDKEIEAERFARDILGINLDARITTTEASFNHKELKLYQNIQEVFTNLDGMYSSMDSRIKKYEELLQDITMDSIKITMDNGEINMGAWTILSQAREWDLEILAKMRGFQVKTEEDVNQALEEFQNQLPITENIINGVMEVLSESPLIADLRDALKEGIDNTSDLAVKLAQEEAARAKDMIDLSYANAQALAAEKQALVERLVQESEERVDAITREAEIRQEKLTQEALDRSEEITERLGVVTSEVTQNVGAITDRINSEIAERTQMIADQAQALLNESATRAAAISTQADALAAESLARRNAITAQADALNLEVTNRTQALKDQQEALSSQIVSTNATTLAALDSRATAIASDYNTKVTNLNNQLTASIEDLETGVTTRLTSLDDEDGKLLQNIEAYKTSNNGNVAAIRSDLTTLSTEHGTTASKVEGLTASFTGLDGKVSKNTSSIASEATARSNADSALGIRIDNLTASTSGKFTEVNSSITDVSEAVTSLEQSTATRFTGLDSSISGVDDKADTAISNAASAQNTANTAVTTNTAQAEEISKLQGRLETTEGDLLTKASADVVSGIITDVSNIEGELSVQATSIEDLSASLLLVDAKADTANTVAADAQFTANTAVSDNAATANRVDTLESNMTQVQGDLTTKATASALELTNTEVTRLDGLTQTHSSSITDLNNELVTTNSNVTKALNAITIAETPTNQLPSWYWANHPMRIVNEVKTASVIGVTGLGTKVNLETRVYSTAQASGPIVQRVISATDPTLEMVRRSTSASAWSAWTQPLKDIKADIATKASSSALSSLDSKVTDIDGRVTSQATSISELEADLTETNNLLGTVKTTAASALDTANAAVTANDAQATDITQLQAKMVAAEGTLSRKADANALSSLETKVNNNQSATSTRIDELTAAITDLGEGAETNVDVYAFNALKAEVNTAKGNITSNTTAITDLGNSLNTLDNTVQDIEQETTANANAIQDTSTQVSDIQGQVTSQGTSITNLRTDLSTAQNTANNAASLASTKADATAFNALDTKVTKIDGQVSSQASDITEIKADITDLDGKVDTKADSSALSALTTEVGEVDGKVTTNANALTKLGGRVSEVEGKVATKAEASALSDYYTKVQADNKAAEIAAGKVEEFSASISNEHLQELLVDGNKQAYSNGSLYQVAGFTMKEAREVGATYTLRFKLTINREGNDTTSYIRAYQGGNAALLRNYTKADGTIFEATFKATASTPVNEIRFYHFPNNTSTKEGTSVTVHWASLVKAEDDAKAQTQAALEANSTAIQNTNAEVARVDGRVTATNSAQSLLEGRLQTVEGEVTKKADASALSSLSTRVDTEEGKSLSQGNAITSLQNAINHATTGLASKAASTAVTAVDNKVTAANGRIDTTNSNVTKLTGRVSTVEGAVSTKAEASALTALTTRVSNAEGVNTSQGSAITTLENSVNHATTGLSSKASSAALTSVDNKVTAANGRIDTTNSNVSTLSGRVSTVEGNVAKKADASALTALTTRVGNAEGVNTSQGSAITTLENSVNHKTTGLATKAATTALTATNSEVSRVNGLVTGHTNQLTQLASDITTINGTLETKANASALNDIYTKTQADTKATQIAAGEVSKYDAKLTLGGSNLYFGPNPVYLRSQTSAGRIVFAATASGNTQRFDYLSNDNLDLSGLQVGDPTIASIEIFVPSTDTSDYTIQFGTYRFSGTSYVYAPSVDVKALPKDTWVKLTTAPGTYVSKQPATGINLVFNLVGRKTAGDEIQWRNFMMEKASKASAFSESDKAVQSKLDANATAITNTNTEVARVDGRVTTESNRITTLTGRVSTVEGNITKKADASALSSLDTRVGTVEGQYTSQASDITKLNNSLATTNVNVGTAQTAAQNAMNAAGAKGKVIFGNTAPAVADRLTQNLWIDTTSNANTPKRWNGSAWVVVTDKVATDAAKAVKDLDATVKTKADVSALNSLTTKVTDEAGKTAANTSSITTLNSDIVKINNDIATKANASALSDMYTKNQVDDKAAEIAAGEVNKYDAKLTIGGSNLYSGPNPIPLYWQTAEGELTATASSGSALQMYKYLEDSWLDLESVSVDDSVITSIEIMVPSDSVVGEHIIRFSTYRFGASSYHHGEDRFLKDFPRDKWVKVSSPVGKFVGANVTSPAHINISLYLMSRDVGTSFKWRNLMMEKGTKASAFSESDKAVQTKLDANSTAIQATNAEVVKVDGKTITNANSIIKLNSDVTEVKNGLTTKANTSALQDYYTRSETDGVATTAAAGEVSKYDASLVIGGTNHYPSTTDKWLSKTFGGWQSYLNDMPIGDNESINNGDTITWSGTITSEKNEAGLMAHFYRANAAYVQIQANYIPAGEVGKVVGTAVVPDGVIGLRLALRHTAGDAPTSLFKYKGLKVEKGTKATAWSPSPNDVQNSLDANATAIENTNAEVKKVDGRVTTESNRITTLAGRVSTNEKGLALKADVTALNDIYTKTESDAKATSLAAGEVSKYDAKLVVGGKNLFSFNDWKTNQITPQPTFTTVPVAPIELLPNTTYTISTNYPSRGGSAFDIFVTTSKVAANSAVNGVALDMPRTFTTNDTGTAYVHYRDVNLNPGSSHWIQVERGSSATDYVPNQTDTYSILSHETEASATALSTLDVKVEKVDGRVSTQAEQMLVLTSDNKDNKNALAVQAKVVDGVKANYMVKMESNGVIGGFGLMQSTGALGQVQTSFGVNANTFFIGAPASKKQPFIVTTTNQVVNGVKYPAGTYIDVALIANATIGNAHIADASITNAKIKELDAAKITTGTLDAKRIRIGSSTQFDSGFAPTDVLNDAKTYADAIEVGAANLLYRSYDKDLWTTHSSPKISLSSDHYIMENSMLVTQTTFEGSGGAEILKVYRKGSNLEVGKTLTVSAYVKNRGTKNLTVNTWGMLTSSAFVVAPGKIERVVITGTLNQDSVNFRISTAAVADAFKVDIVDLKFEYGNKATSWTPSPAEVNALIDSKAKTFLTTPTVPYSAGDIWKDGTTTKVAILYRGTGSFTASDWVLVGDVTANNTAADSNKLGGTAAATVVNNAAKGIAVYNDVMSDLKITPVEKTSLNTEWTRIKAEYTNMLAHAASMAVSTTAFTSAYNALNSTTPTMTSILSSMTTTTTLTAAQRDALRTQFTNYYAQVTALSKAISDKVANNAKAYTDAVEVGGRNLLVGKPSDGSFWRQIGQVQVEANGVMRIPKGAVTTASINPVTVIPGESYVVSYSAKTDVPGSFAVVLLDYLTSSNSRVSYDYPAIAVTGEWKRYHHVITVPNSANIAGLAVSPRFNSTNGTYILLKDVKVEKGNKATDWSPAPEDVDTAIATKAKTFTTQPTTPYTSGDLWRNGGTIRVCTVTRASGSYVAADWTLVGDVTSANTAANSNQLGGKASATVLGDISSAKSAADTAASKATAAENQLTLWKYPNTTEIDGGKIRTNSVTANQINVANLSLISGNLGTIKVGTANIDDLAVTTAKIGNLQVDTLKIKDRAVTVPITTTKPGIATYTSPRSSSTLNITTPDWFNVTLTGFSPNSQVMVYIGGQMRASSHYHGGTSVGPATVHCTINLKVNNTVIREAKASSSHHWDTSATATIGSSAEALSVVLATTDSTGKVVVAASSTHTGGRSYRDWEIHWYAYGHSDMIIHILELKK